MIFKSQQNARMVYENAYSLLSTTKGVSKTALDNAVLTQSFIRLIQPLAINQTVFSFPVLNNQQGSGTAVRPDEQRLNLQDAAFVYAIQVYIAKASSATATNWIPETYPNVIVFPTGAGSLYQLYNGKMIININNSTIVPAARMMSFLQIPQTQQTAALGTGISQDQLDGTLLPPWEPNIVFCGLYNTVVDIRLPGAMTAVDATTLCIIECEVILAQNVALGAPN